MTESSINIQHSRLTKQKQVDATPSIVGIESLRKESDHTISTASFVPSSFDDTATVHSSTTNTPTLSSSHSPRPGPSGELLQPKEQSALGKNVQHHPYSSLVSPHRGSAGTNESPARPDLENCPARQAVREEEERTLVRVSPIAPLSRGIDKSLNQRQPLVGSVPDSANLSRLSSSSSGGSTTVTVQVVRPCPVKKGPAPAAVTILSPLPVQCVPPSPAETVSTASHTAKQQEGPKQQQQLQQPHEQQEKGREVSTSKLSEEEEVEKRQQLEEAAAKRQQKALEEEARRRQQQIQQEEFRRRLQQQQLQNQARQREAAAVRLKEQQQKAKEEAKQRQADQCAFPAREPQQQPKSQSGKESGMGSSDRGMPHSAHVQIGGRQAANGPIRENGNAPYQHPHAPPQQQVRQNMRTISTDTTSAGIKTPHGSIDMDSSVAGAPPPAPLFERIVSEEVQELKEYARMIESQSARLAELQRIHDDLERRLEMQTKDRMELEATLEKRERMWAGKCEVLEKERDQWKSMVQAERTKNERLLDQVYRKEKEIHRMVQRKYDSDRHPPHGHSHHTNEGLRALKRTGSDRATTQHGSHSSVVKASSATTGERSHPNIHHKSPHEILAASGSVEAVRERNVTNSLLDFFGM